MFWWYCRIYIHEILVLLLREKKGERHPYWFTTEHLNSILPLFCDCFSFFFAMCFSHQKYGKRTRKFNNVNINLFFFFFFLFFRVFSKWFRQKWILLGFVSVVLSEQTWLTVDFDNIKFYVSVCDSTRALYTKHNCPVEGQPLWQMKLQLIYRLALLP